jgi:glycogen operon protein
MKSENNTQDAADVPVSCPYPLGASVTPEGTNFSVFSASAKGMQIVLFDHPDDPGPARTITLDPVRDRTSHYWHIFLSGIKHGQLYGYRADGPCDPAAGQRFDCEKVLLDPYGKSVSIGDSYSRAAACKPGDNAAVSMKSVVADLSVFDWEDDRPIHRLFRDTVIYEMHVGGLTRHPSSCVADDRRGTYLGVIDKIPYLRDLGITAVELLPVYQFDALDAPPGLVNYWGYGPISFFAPHLAYGTNKHDPLGCLDEFRTMVKALHRAGIEGESFRSETLDSRQPQVLGLRDARGRISLRSRLNFLPRRFGPARAQRTHHLGDRFRSCACWYQVDRRSLGFRRSLPGG